MNCLPIWQLAGPLALRCLDLFKSVFVEDTSLSMLLRRCPNLEQVTIIQFVGCHELINYGTCLFFLSIYQSISFPFVRLSLCVSYLSLISIRN
jgi:hypothetical protein